MIIISKEYYCYEYNKINILYNFVFLITTRTTSYNNNVIRNTGMTLASLAECKYLYKATTIW